jgi:hypothetical protein
MPCDWKTTTSKHLFPFSLNVCTLSKHSLLALKYNFTSLVVIGEAKPKTPQGDSRH